MYTLFPHDTSLPSGYSKRKRPHIYPGGATFMIGMRLAGSITRPAIKRVLALRRKYGQQIPPKLYWEATAEERVGFRKLLQGADSRRDLNGPFHLHHSETCRQILIESLAFRDGMEYEIIAYSLMPNHIHLVVRHLSSNIHMGELIWRIRKFTGRKSNEVLGLTGNEYWERESYDHIIQTQSELKQQVKYTLMNPVVCGLAKRWQDWPGNYLMKEWQPE
ncbi:MAG: transposase [Saprospiraceae bacterium]